MAFESEVSVTETDEPKIDLNAASEEDLRTLSGIGSALAQRVIAYRETHTGFQAPEDITKVSGIGQALYGRWAHRLTVSPRGDNGAADDEKSTAEAERQEDSVKGAAKMDERKGISVVGTDVVMAEEQIAESEAEEPVSDISESAYEEEMIAEAEAEIEEMDVDAEEEEMAPEPIDAPTPFEPAELPEEEEKEEEEEELAARPEPVAEAPQQRGTFWGWVLAALLGGILGMIFSLLVFAGINGTLDINNSTAILDLQDRVEGLSAELAAQETAIDGLAGRVSALENITPRVEEVETAITGLKEETQRLSDQADAVSSKVETLADNIGELEENVTTSMTFFTRLQELLNETFGGINGQSE